LLSAPVKNLGTADRLLRVILAEVCILVAFFWAPMEWQIPLYLVAAVMLLQAATSTCGLYNLLGWNSCEIVKRNDKKMVAGFVVVALAIALVGGYASAVLSKNIFLENLEQVKGPLLISPAVLRPGAKKCISRAIREAGGCVGRFPSEVL
jgi:hypothetical protein